MTKGASSQKRSKSDLLSSLDTACRIYAPAREMCVFKYESFEESTYHPNVAAKVVGLAFLSVVAAWEDFLSNIYLGYLSGYPSPSGYIPEHLCGKARNKSHALLLASGECDASLAERRMKWSNFKWVKSLSTVHFKKKNPFFLVSDSDARWLDLAVTIRNRVAHDSDKARKSFKTAVNNLFLENKNSPLPQGFSPGQLLIIQIQPFNQLHPLAADDHHWGDIFEGYISLYSRLAEELCPG